MRKTENPSIFPIYIPALSERPEDVPVLLDFLILQQSRRMGYITPPKLPPSEIRRLCAYPWPGNIREMLNAVTRAMLLWDGRAGTFGIEVGRNLFEGMFAGPSGGNAEDRPQAAGIGHGRPLRLEDAERDHVRAVLEMTGGRVTGRGGAAELLDVNPSTLRGRMRRLGIR
ncbi:MAG: hypothetical protein MJ061_05925 [Mailhella sp.]|nr:hypothetical protein [Mailhella sp.]